jgi:hypothetical protein
VTGGRRGCLAPGRDAVDDLRMTFLRRPTPTVALLLTAVLLLAACGGGGGDGGDGGDGGADGTVPSTTASGATGSGATASSTTFVVQTRTTSVFFVRDERLVAASRQVSTSAGVEAGLRALFQGPNPQEKLAGMSSAVPEGVSVNGVRVADGVATVDLSRAFERGGGSLSMTLRVAQVTYTALQIPGVERVRYALDGVPVTVLGGEGLLLDAPQTRRDLEDTQPRILVESPGQGATVRSGFTARGSSNAFEATHRLQVIDRTGAVVVDTAVTASSGTGTRGTWETRVELPAGVRGPVFLRVFETSAENGRPLGLVDIDLTVV